jgi:hypothetical protein
MRMAKVEIKLNVDSKFAERNKVICGQVSSRQSKTVYEQAKE